MTYYQDLNEALATLLQNTSHKLYTSYVLMETAECLFVSKLWGHILPGDSLSFNK